MISWLAPLCRTYLRSQDPSRVVETRLSIKDDFEGINRESNGLGDEFGIHGCGCSFASVLSTFDTCITFRRIGMKIRLDAMTRRSISP